MTATKKKLRALQFWSWVCLLAPIMGVVGFNAREYFTLETGFIFPQAVEVSIGFSMAIVAGVMLVLKKTTALRGSRGFWIALIIAIFLKAVLSDLILILTAVASGSTIYGFFQPAIATTLETFKYEKQATIQAAALGNVMKAPAQTATNEPILRSGRV
jgi:hypothetical protein